MTEKKPRAKKIKVQIEKGDQAKLEKIGLKMDWLQTLGKQYGFVYFEYLAKFKAFRCYQNDKEGNQQHRAWIDVNELSMINGGRRLTDINLKYQRPPKSRQIIELPWS